MNIDPVSMIRPRRKILGISAVLLPILENGEVDWAGFVAHVERTRDVGLIPAVNMDTGYGNLLDGASKMKVLELTRDVLGKESFVAGVFVGDRPGSGFDCEAYVSGMIEVVKAGAVPVVCQSFGLTGLGDEELVKAYQDLGRGVDRFIGFELGTMFAPFGKIYSLEVYDQIMRVPSCWGAKHSSLSRDLEWQRLLLRDRVRPEFKVLTGNDLAIDMVMYGSDYLLGLSTFAPDLFARRDRYWERGDPAFYEFNDRLQYLGCFAFREPVPAYKHSAAMFLKLRGWLGSDRVHPRCPVRGKGDRSVLLGMLEGLENRI